MASFAVSPFPGNTVGRFPSSPSDSDRDRSCRRGDSVGGCSFLRSHPSSFVIICTLERPDNKLTRVSSSIAMQSYPHPIPYTFYALASLALTLCKVVAVPSVPGLNRRPRSAKCREGEEEFSPMEVKERGEFRGLLTMQGGEEFSHMEAKKRGEFGSVSRMQGGGEFAPVEVQKRAEFGAVSRVQEGVESTLMELQKRAKFGGTLRVQGGGGGKGESSTLMGLLKRGELGGILRMQGGEEFSLMESQKMGEFGGVLRMQGGGLGMALLSTTAIAKDQLSPVLATLLANPTFVSGAVAWAVAQVLKVFTTFFVERRWDFKMLLSSGGMPSSHSALCAALTMSVALSHGVGDALFPVCLGFSLIVMYDATGVRRHAGMQAEVLNLIVEDLFKGHPISEKKLKELLGHTPLQVAAGAFLGVLVGYFCSIGNSVIPGMGV